MKGRDQELLARLRALGSKTGAADRAIGASLLYFDVNGLKSINDGHGHAAGDATLIHVAAVLRAHIRASDVVGRWAATSSGCS